MRILTLMMLMAVGCGKTAEEKVVGTYEAKKDGDTFRGVLLANGIAEAYLNGEKREHEGTWTISKDGELIAIFEGIIEVSRINPDGSLTVIALITDGERKDIPKGEQWTVKKIK